MSDAICTFAPLFVTLKIEGIQAYLDSYCWCRPLPVVSNDVRNKSLGSFGNLERSFTFVSPTTNGSATKTIQSEVVEHYLNPYMKMGGSSFEPVYILTMKSWALFLLLIHLAICTRMEVLWFYIGKCVKLGQKLWKGELSWWCQLKSARWNLTSLCRDRGTIPFET